MNTYLWTHPLYHVHHHNGALTQTNCGGHLAGEVHMSRGVNQVNQELFLICGGTTEYSDKGSFPTSLYFYQPCSNLQHFFIWQLQGLQNIQHICLKLPTIQNNPSAHKFLLYSFNKHYQFEKISIFRLVTCCEFMYMYNVQFNFYSICTCTSI